MSCWVLVRDPVEVYPQMMSIFVNATAAGMDNGGEGGVEGDAGITYSQLTYSRLTTTVAAAAATAMQHCNSSFLFSVVPVLLLSSLVPWVLTAVCWMLWSMHSSHVRSATGSKLPLPPGSMGFPLIGETLHFILGGASFYKKRHRLYGNVYKTHLLGRPTVRVMGAENARKVLMGENSLVTSYWPSSVRLVLGSNNITMSSGQRHNFLRKSVLKAFGADALKSYAPVMQREVRHHIHNWGHQDENLPILGYPQCRSLTFSVVCQALLGLDHLGRPEMEELLGVFETFTESFFSLPIRVPGSRLSKGLHARERLLQKIDEWMKRKEELASEGMTSSGTDALQLMMTYLRRHEGQQLTREEQKEVCLDLMFAGHATAASAATSLFYLLARNPRVIERILAELEEHGLMESDADDLTFDTVSRLTYVGHVVKEVLRMLPPVGGAFRKALKTFELDGYQIPEGWTVSLSIRETQAFSQLYTEGDQFQPERWEQPLAPGKETFNYMPFGRGARSCVGKEYAKLLLKILVVEMCRNCCWRLLSEDVQMRLLPVPHPVDDLPMKVTLLRDFEDFAAPQEVAADATAAI